MTVVGIFKTSFLRYFGVKLCGNGDDIHNNKNIFMWHYWRPAGLSVISHGGKWLPIDHLSVLFNYSMHNTMIKGPIADLNCLSLGRMRGEFDKLKMTSLAFNRAKDPSKSWGCTEGVLFPYALEVVVEILNLEVSMFTLFVITWWFHFSPNWLAENYE